MYTLDDFEPYLDADTIQAKVSELGKQISDDLAGSDEPLMVIGILKGSMVFMADLIRHIEHPLVCDFLRARSYEGTSTTGVVRIEFDVTTPLEGYHVLLVEDIIDTGLTMDYLLGHLELKGPASVKVCSLLRKPDAAQCDVPCHYLGFDIPNRFVIGYGLDYDQKYRNLADIRALSETSGDGE